MQVILLYRSFLGSSRNLLLLVEKKDCVMSLQSVSVDSYIQIAFTETPMRINIYQFIKNILEQFVTLAVITL